MLITNFCNKEIKVYREALKKYKEETGERDLYIDKNAYLRDGRRDTSMSALRCKSNKDLSYFWKIFDSLGNDYK